jgi:hypothetical protein
MDGGAMNTHGTLTTIHRDAVVAIAAANNPTIPSHALTYAQMVLSDLAANLSRDTFNHWPYMWRVS